MSDELEFKYEVEIKSVEKRQMLSKEVKEELKESGLMDEKGKLKISLNILHFSKLAKTTNLS